MNRRQSIQHILIGTAALSSPLSAFAQSKAPPAKPNASAAAGLELLNKAARQRMLSQRMAKCYFQMGNGILPERAFALMTSCVDEFDSNLKLVSSKAPAGDIKAIYQNLETTWKPYKSQLSIAPSRMDAGLINTSSDVVLKLADDATNLLEKQVGLPLARLVNLSGRQRMLSQLVSKKLFYREWTGQKNEDASIIAGEAEISKGLASLASESREYDNILAEIGLAQTQWLFFKAAIDAALNSKTTSIHLQNVANTSERMLEVFDSITMKYQKMA
jgi:Type IV pili methyl-accepting chemotaxis transducer N-term